MAVICGAIAAPAYVVGLAGDTGTLMHELEALLLKTGALLLGAGALLLKTGAATPECVVAR